MSAKIRCPTLLLVALCFVLQVFAIRFPLPPGSEKCFTEDLNVGTKCLLNYHFESAPEVFSFLMLFDPAGSQIFMRENPENGHYQFTTSLAGPYKICARSEKDDEADFLIHAQRLDADGKPLDDQGERIQFAGKKKQEDEDDDYDEDDDSTLVKIELLTGMQAQPESKTLKESSLKPLEVKHHGGRFPFPFPLYSCFSCYILQWMQTNSFRLFYIYIFLSCFVL
eukprot:TRINITY_DN10280_c0_g1_i2.p1 TRINITY_DN10280_c0_g1~~TRINITY_DN10280_c0_g1_i2.p1  ORF type:complete len:224 (+),score=51.17 TRINITY_DN10280_c0_g1_i2:43-714(+)